MCMLCDLQFADMYHLWHELCMLCLKEALLQFYAKSLPFWPKSLMLELLGENKGLVSYVALQRYVTVQ